MRERGLKCIEDFGRVSVLGRSREGAWIEIGVDCTTREDNTSRSREGAWIEMLKPGIGADYFRSLP